MITTAMPRRSRIFPGYSRRGIALSISAAAVLGLVGVVGAVLLRSDVRHSEAPLFPTVRRAIEGFGVGSLIFLGLAGFVVGLFRRAPWFIIGLSTMALFPLLSLAELIADPTSHSLLPLEWFVYGVETTPAILGAYLATLLGGKAAL